MIIYVLFMIGIVYISAAISTTVGFGLSTLLMPIFVWLMSFEQALMMSALLHMFHNAGKVLSFRRSIYWPEIGWFGIPAVSAVLLSSFFIHPVVSVWIRLIFAAVLIAQVLFLIYLPQRKLIRTTSFWSVIYGFSMGISSTLFGVQGIIRTHYFVAAGYTPHELIATSGMISLLVDGVRTVLYSMNGLLQEWDNGRVILTLVLCLSVAAGVRTGRYIVDYINTEYFRKLVIGALVCAVSLYAFQTLLEGWKHYKTSRATTK